jgi:hypothetical protein
MLNHCQTLAFDSTQAQTIIFYIDDYFMVTTTSLNEICNIIAAHFDCPIEANRLCKSTSKPLIKVD